MRIFLKKLYGVLITVFLTINTVMPVFASANSEPLLPPKSHVIMETDLNGMDISKPFSTTENFRDMNGIPVAIVITYSPAPQTRGSSTTTASSGTWTSKASYGAISMSYQFDLAKSGSEWRISNGRNLNYSGVLCTFSNPNLSISRSVSTSTVPAEINGSVTGKTAVNSAVCLLTTKISHNGMVTTSWN